MLFPGTPRFKQNLPNKRYYPTKNKWVFLDDGGNVYVYDPVMGTVRHRHFMLK